MDPEKDPETSDSITVTMDSDKETELPQTSTPEAEIEEEFLTGIKLILSLFAVTIVGFLISLDASIVVTAIPRITAAFNSVEDIGWYGSAYLISNCACQLNSGKIYQYHSLKITFIVYVCIFELGSLICGVAQSSAMLIIGRAIAGIGGSGILNGGFTIITIASPIQKRPQYLGIVMGFVLIGFVAGPLLGGLITQDASWRWCFYINLPIGGAAAVVIASTKLPGGKSVPTARLSYFESLKQIDPVGFLTFAPFCIMLLLALQWGGSKYPWNSATIIGLLCGAAAMLCVFIAWEHRMRGEAMLPLNMLSQRIVYSSCLASTFQFGGMQIIAYYLPVWFQVIKSASPSMSGVYYLGTIGPQLVVAVSSGALISRLGYYTPWAIGGNAFSSIGFGLLSTLTVASDASKYIGYQVFGGLARGAVMQQPVTAVTAAVPKNLISVGTALVVFTQFFGGGIFVAFAQTTFTNSLGPALAKFAPNVSAAHVISVGATNLRESVPASELNGVLEAYNQALVHTFYLAAGTSVAAFCASWGMGWVNMKKAKQGESNI